MAVSSEDNAESFEINSRNSTLDSLGKQPPTMPQLMSSMSSQKNRKKTIGENKNNDKIWFKYEYRTPPRTGITTNQIFL